jgi:hypothetical protein
VHKAHSGRSGNHQALRVLRLTGKDGVRNSANHVGSSETSDHIFANRCGKHGAPKGEFPRLPHRRFNGPENGVNEGPVMPNQMSVDCDFTAHNTLMRNQQRIGLGESGCLNSSN